MFLHILMFTTIMCALWLGSAGPIMVGGLYTRFGNLTGAWCSLICGSGTSLLGVICQYNWAKTIYPWLENRQWVGACDRVLVLISSPFDPWIRWTMDPVKFPINSYEIFFLAMTLGIGGYVAGSLLTYRPYDLDKLLHRGRYSDGSSEDQPPFRWSPRAVFRMLIGIDSEYTRGDKVLAWSVFLYSFGYALGGTFFGVIVWNWFSRWPIQWWSNYFFFVYLVVPGIIGVVSTFWFLWGGTRDTVRLFRDLKERVEDAQDNGQIIEAGKD